MFRILLITLMLAGWQAPAFTVNRQMADLNSFFGLKFGVNQTVHLKGIVHPGSACVVSIFNTTGATQMNKKVHILISNSDQRNMFFALGMKSESVTYQRLSSDLLKIRSTNRSAHSTVADRSEITVKKLSDKKLVVSIFRSDLNLESTCQVDL